MMNKLIVFIIFFIGFKATCFSQERLAILKKGIKYAEISLNNNIIGKVYKNDTFLIYEPQFEYESCLNIWTKKGENGCIDKTKIKILSEDIIPFKMTFEKKYIIEQACSKHSKENFNIINIDYCSLIKNITNKNKEELKKFFNLLKRLKAAQIDIHNIDTWKILNYYSDKEFYSFLRSLDDEEKGEIANYLMDPMVTYPIIKNIEKYYKKYYPLTWSIIKKYYKKL